MSSHLVCCPTYSWLLHEHVRRPALSACRAVTRLDDVLLVSGQTAHRPTRRRGWCRNPRRGRRPGRTSLLLEQAFEGVGELDLPAGTPAPGSGVPTTWGEEVAADDVEFWERPPAGLLHHAGETEHRTGLLETGAHRRRGCPPARRRRRSGSPRRGSRGLFATPRRRHGHGRPRPCARTCRGRGRRRRAARRRARPPPRPLAQSTA